MDTPQQQQQQQQQRKQRRPSLDLIDTGKPGSKQGYDYAIDLGEHTGVVEDRTHVDDHAYTSNYYNRYASKDASTGAGFEPAVSQRIAGQAGDERSTTGNEGGASTHQLPIPSQPEQTGQDSSVFELRGAPDKARLMGSPASRIRAGLEDHTRENPSRIPLMFNQDGSRHEPLNMNLRAENAQCFKDDSFFGAGVCGHSADEQAFAHPLSATGRRRESVMLTQMEQQQLQEQRERARQSQSAGDHSYDYEEQPLNEEPEPFDDSKST
ncbi:hypothetical protein SYNPS1DRAFT_30253 [Syncephalis pseudoplumigaleata]|uniref:Uncharacterized protein n=1 Tax=Syncephalis pseudoplumigaleata TaxID=1712513 RepID=A0A4P9YV91_9FUNG|nr:hypothetical protein SYNPS1DRAFT_30253 [Syncephalis pseudoplumigaleata]|eukprot:RKP23973.1 hypothetical protein SYNPS1DRAFT_30253 [Syncephalis pseudoplumigaleata]